MGCNSMHWKFCFESLFFNSKACHLVCMHHYLELAWSNIYDFFLKSSTPKVQFHWSLSFHFNIHFILPWISFSHTLILQFIFLGWICAPLFQAPSLKVFQVFNFTFEGWCPYQHLVKLGASHRFCLLCVFFYPNSCPFFNSKFSTISSKWYRCESFIHVASFGWHPFNFTKYCLPLTT